MSEDRPLTYAVQGGTALIGITLGVIPLIGMALGRGPGLWQAVLADGSAHWWVPALVVAICVATIAFFERATRS